MKISQLIDTLNKYIETWGDIEARDFLVMHVVSPRNSPKFVIKPIKPSKDIVHYTCDGTLEKLSSTRKSKWHSVKDKLPEPMKWKLLADRDGSIHVGYGYSAGTTWFTEYGHELYNITHWRELPQLPR